MSANCVVSGENNRIMNAKYTTATVVIPLVDRGCF